MKLYPAIDVQGGRSVRLLRGDRDQVTHYGDDPLAMAKHWETEGAEALHLVDLDAAFGDGDNGKLLESILASASVPVQIGGGVRSFDRFRRWVELGAARVVFGTAAVEAPEVVMSALDSRPERVAIGVDVRSGRVAVRGWETTAEPEPLEFAAEWFEKGARLFITTDVQRDGSLEGPNLEAAARFAAATTADVIASGGVGSLEDLRRLRRLAAETSNLLGVITGRALYENRFTLAEATSVLAEPL